MSTLIYSFLASLDGYVHDAQGKFDWATPDAEVHRFVNDVQRSISTHLYGRTMYEVMAVWETDPNIGADSPEMAEYSQMWQQADKVVFSTTLPEVWTSRTRLERTADRPTLEAAINEAKGDVAISGRRLADTAWQLDLVAEVHVYIAPILVGGGLPMFPDGLRRTLTLTDERCFGNGMVFVRYEVDRD